MQSPIYTAFYTAGTLYEREAARLVASLDRLKLERDVRPIVDRGSWRANTGYTAEHLCQVMADHPRRPVVYLDADAVVWRNPILFDDLEGRCDVAVHYRQGRELLNGTLYLAPTDAARQAVERYREYVVRGNPSNEQAMLANALDDLSDLVKVERLPAGYCWIHDLMAEDLAAGEAVVIEHLQASRETYVTHRTDSRRRRLAEIGDLTSGQRGRLDELSTKTPR